MFGVESPFRCVTLKYILYFRNKIVVVILSMLRCTYNVGLTHNNYNFRRSKIIIEHLYI